jgi:uridine phosphorylase
MIQNSELILNPDGSVYHLHLLPEMIAETILLVGDPGRVSEISAHFDHIEFRTQNREITTHTGTYKNLPVTVMSTGMGTDNIDIVLNEIDALFNIDLETRQEKKFKKSARLIRLGTSGALQEDIAPGTLVMASYGLGLDGLMNFYDAADVREEALTKAFIDSSDWPSELARPYAVKAADSLRQLFQGQTVSGITVTAPGFYGPQNRVLRVPLAYADMTDRLSRFSWNGCRGANFEMETSALYGLGKKLGHETLTICAVIANRKTKTYLSDYKPHVRNLIEMTLDTLVKNQ